jgi:uncharacterized protein YndB with AHSA1/START domain
MSSQTLSFTKLVNAPPEEVYRAFTNATALREWLCNFATVIPRPGGRFYLWWNSGYFTSGEFTLAENGKKVAFSWHGRGEPAPTHVQVTFTPEDGGTMVNVEHEGVGTDENWSQIVAEIKKGWENGLENLASVLETGEDQRFVLRPLLGIILDEFNPQIAKRLSVPTNEGIRLSGTVEGMGARAAGLAANDVIVSMGGIDTSDGSSVDKVLATYRAGDEIEVVFYREGEKMSVTMELSRRPIPDIPPTAKELAQAVEMQYNEIMSRLDEFLEGVTEEEASFKPGPQEWSLKGNLAHFIQGERYFQQYIAELVDGYERFADDFGGNIDPFIEATIAAYPTVKDLVKEYKSNMAETVHFIAYLPDEFVARKGTFWRLAYNALQDLYHLDSHLEQMQAALDAARKN